MNGKKILLIILAFLIALVIVLLSMNFADKQNESSLPVEQEQVTSEEVKTDITEPVSTDNSKENKSLTDKKVGVKKINPIKKVLHIAPKENENVIHEEKTIKEEIKTESASSAERKFTPEEEEALKKDPTAKVVVVDKEIKLKSSGKYRFK